MHLLGSISKFLPSGRPLCCSAALPPVCRPAGLPRHNQYDLSHYTAADRQSGRAAERQSGRTAERLNGRAAERPAGRQKFWNAPLGIDWRIINVRLLFFSSAMMPESLRRPYKYRVTNSLSMIANFFTFSTGLNEKRFRA